MPPEEIDRCNLGAFKSALLLNGPELLRLAHAYIAGDLPRILVLCGPVGTGKTMLAQGIMGALLDKGFYGRFERTVDFLDHIRRTYGGGRGQDSVAVMEWYYEHPLVVFDDLGSEQQTDWVGEQFYKVFDYRYRTKARPDGTPLLTIVTMNRLVGEMADDRIASRLQDSRVARVVVFKGTDVRRQLAPEAWGRD